MLGSGRAASITNNNRYFIAFADSCLTNAFESNDSMSEELLKNPNGGAVAYLGHTRFSWIGLGDDYQRAFFHELVHTRHLGLMHRSRLDILQSHPNDHYHKWTVLALNLLGDPEMEVWKSKPFRVVIDIRLIESRLYVRAWDADDLSRRELHDVRVRFYAGENEYSPQVLEDGSILLPSGWEDSSDFRFTVSAPGSLPRTLTRDEICKMATRWEAELPAEEITEETAAMPVSELAQEIVPLSTANVPVLEMQTEPQHN